MVAMKTVPKRVALRVLWLMRGVDFAIFHQWARKYPFRLNLYRHKAYWNRGRKREPGTMAFFGRFLKPGMVAWDVGAHIGYLSFWFAYLVGPSGRVLAIEPGSDNLRYLRQNARVFPHITVVEAAVTDEDGTVSFFEENITGQNNCISDGLRHLEEMKAKAGVPSVVKSYSVKSVCLDTIWRDTKLSPDLIKIDAEGAEPKVMRGVEAVIAAVRPAILIEVTTGHAEIWDALSRAGYQIFDPENNFKEFSSAHGNPLNWLALHSDNHSALVCEIRRNRALP